MSDWQLRYDGISLLEKPECAARGLTVCVQATPEQHQ
jgi:hypothetical protein